MVAAADKIVSDMLKENTGTHFLDSGGEGGRRQESNSRYYPKMFCKVCKTEKDPTLHTMGKGWCTHCKDMTNTEYGGGKAGRRQKGR